MATKYSDIFKIGEGHPVYNIVNEEADRWRQFIVNDQFTKILTEHVLTSVRKNDVSQHKPFWLDGTYGSGKSHASAVIKHLLCDEVDDIRSFVEREYADNEAVRESIFSLRRKTRLFPVCLLGLNAMTHLTDLSVVVQKAVVGALAKRGITLSVKTDIDCYVEHMDSHPWVWDEMIENNSQLRSAAKSTQDLKASLVEGDTSILETVRQCLRNEGISINLSANSLKDWLFQMQDELRAKAPEYNGFLIVWDEFTQVMTSNICLGVLDVFQSIAEDMGNNMNNDSYFLLISHPSAFNSLGNEERKKTMERYHRDTYDMEPVSAFKIMTRLLEVADADQANRFRESFYADCGEVVDFYADSADGKEESRKNLLSLLPLHPGTANLASSYARIAGSQSRSVFEFIESGDVKSFLDNEGYYEVRALITADMLWDFVVNAFRDNNRLNLVTEKFATYEKVVKEAGPAVTAVFKGILLLNALNSLGGNAATVPNEENVRHLFIGSQYANGLDDALKFINDRQIVQRDPSGIYSVQFAALDPDEVLRHYQALNEKYKFTSEVAKFDGLADERLGNLTANVWRPTAVEVFSKNINDRMLQSAITNKLDDERPWELKIAYMLGCDMEEVHYLESFAEKAAAEPDFRNTIFVIFSTPLDSGDRKRDDMVKYLANMACAESHANRPQSDAMHKNARVIVGGWLDDVRRGNFVCCLRKEKMSGAGATNLSDAINNFSKIIFPNSPEVLSFGCKQTSTMWVRKMSKEDVRSVLTGKTFTFVVQKTAKLDPSALESKSGQPDKIIPLILRDVVNENLEFDASSPHHPLSQAMAFTKKKLAEVKTGEHFNLAEKLRDLTRPPFGFYPTFAFLGMMAYVMRDYKGEFFDNQSHAHDDNLLVDDVMEVFKAWETGKMNPKLEFSQQSQDAKELSARIVETFNLERGEQNLKYVRFKMRDYCKKVGFPLWSLKYLPNEQNENINVLIANLVSLFGIGGNDSNNDLISQTLSLLQTFHFELGEMLAVDNFKTGFDAFLCGLPVVNITSDETAEVFAYIVENKEGEVGMWSETDVENKANHWRISKQTQVQPQLPVSPSPAPSTPEPVQPEPEPVSPNLREQAIGRLGSLDADDMRLLLETLCAKGNSEVIDLILKR